MAHGAGRWTFAFAGLLVGALLLSPVAAHVGDQISHLWGDHIKDKTDARYVKKGRITRRANCPWTDFYPQTNDLPYGHTETARFGGPGTFSCGIPLPSGARITDFAAAVLDNESSGQVGCTLNEVDIAPGPLGAALEHREIGSTPKTEVVEGVGPNRILLRDPEISHVTDLSHTYWIDCDVTQNTSELGIYGAFVTYSIARGS